jgi:transposase
MLFAGVDWAARQHQIAVVDDSGRLVTRFGFPHSEQGITGMLGRLAALAASPEIAVAIERPNGLLVERLLAAGHAVYPIHPNAFAAARPRWGASRAKSDPGDAYCLADYLRTDGHRLRPLRPADPQLVELRALCRLRDAQQRARIAASNQLGELLELHWPGARHLFYRLHSPVALAFLERYPTPESTARLGESRMAAFLKGQKYARRSASDLLARLREAPQPASPLAPEVLRVLVRAQVSLMRTILAGLADLEAAISARLAVCAKAALLASLPRVGQVNLAQIVAEVGPILERTETVELVSAEVGASPVTRASGKHRSVSFRHACNTKARKALTTFADNSRRDSPWAAQVYQRARERGCRHPHAIRILARAWLRVIWACWHSERAYDPAQHRSARSLTCTGGLT